MNDKEFFTKWSGALLPDGLGDFVAMLESVRADERANAGQICNEFVSRADERFLSAEKDWQRTVNAARSLTARQIANRIRSGERAPVDGVADEPNVGEWMCNASGKRLGTDVRVAHCPDHPTGTVHKFQHAKPLPTGTPCAVCGCDGSDSSHNSCAECVCWSVGDGHGFGIVPHRVTPDPAAAVTADEMDDTERIPWYKTEEGAPNEGEWVEVSSTTHSPVFVRQYLGSSGAQDWRSPTDVGEHPRHFWPFWRRNPATCPPTAPPVANPWRQTAEELPPANTRMNLGAQHPSFTWPEWRFIAPVSASDTVEADLTDNDKESYEDRWLKACKRHVLVSTDLAVAKRENIDLRSRVANQAKELRRLNSAQVRLQQMYAEAMADRFQLGHKLSNTEAELAQTKIDRDRYADDMGQMRLEIIKLENERGKLQHEIDSFKRTYNDVYDGRQVLRARIASVIAEHDRLAATCGKYERTVTELRSKLEQERCQMETLRSERDGIKDAALECLKALERQERTAGHTRNRFKKLGIVDDLPF